MEDYEVSTAPLTSTLVLVPPRPFRASFRLPEGAEWSQIHASLVSTPEGALPTIPCTIEGGEIRSQEVGLEAYDLRVIGMINWGKEQPRQLLMPAHEAFGKTLEFPPKRGRKKGS